MSKRNRSPNNSDNTDADDDHLNPFIDDSDADDDHLNPIIDDSDSDSDSDSDADDDDDEDDDADDDEDDDDEDDEEDYADDAEDDAADPDADPIAGSYDDTHSEITYPAFYDDLDSENEDTTPRPFSDIVKSDPEILESIKIFSTAYSYSFAAPPLTLSDISDYPECLEVSDLPPNEVREKIQVILDGFVTSCLSDKPASFKVPSRVPSNQLYVPELKRMVLRKNITELTFANNAMKTSMMMHMCATISQILKVGHRKTLRGLYYLHTHHIKDQTDSDNILDDVACMIGCTRNSLNIISDEKGLVIGRIKFMDGENLIDCTKQGVGGKVIPNTNRVSNIESDALFILLVEKHAIYSQLVDDSFHERFPCIIITGKGQPDVATRSFLRKIKIELKLPVLALFDCGPSALSMLSVYEFGSKKMSYDSSNLATPDINWLGIRPSELDKYGIPKERRLSMTKRDIKVAENLLKEPFVKQEWVGELKKMIASGHKADLESLTSFGFDYLSRVYLPLKLQEQDWV